MLLFSSSLPNQDFWAGSAGGCGQKRNCQVQGESSRDAAGAPAAPRTSAPSWFFSPACASSTLEVDGAEGRSVTFHLQGLRGENLAWSFRGETILTIKLGEPPDPSFYEDSYKSRVTFPEDGSALTISQLGKKDAGNYTAKNAVFKANFILRVYSECLFTFRPRGCRYTLRCAVHTPGDKSFSWSRGEQLDAEGPEVVVEAPPPGELDVLSYTCTVRNPVSSSNATVSPAALCAGESPQRMCGWGAGGMLAGTGRILIPAGHSSGSQKAERAWPPPRGGGLCRSAHLSPLSLFSSPRRAARKHNPLSCHR
uniref:Ig-like domain-containing protein n=1 Tax=Anser brachyrhynchus TaxID=132585 RepID=A0A8B9BI85_9AVES